MSDRRSITNAAWLVGQPLILNAVSIPATAFIVIKLGPLGYGEWSVGVSVVAVMSFLAMLGLRPLFIRAVAQDPERAMDALADQLALRTLLAVAAGGIALALGAALRYPPVVLTCLGFCALSLVLATLAGALTDLLQGLELQKQYAGINLISGLVLTVVSVAAAANETGPVGLSIAYVTGPLLSLLLLVIAVRRQYGRIRYRWNLARFRTLLSVSAPVGVQYFVASLRDRAEQLLVPKLVGIAQFGYFAAGSMPASRLAIVPDGIATAYYPVIARTQQESEQAASRQTSQLLLISLVVCLPFAVCLYLLAPSIALLLFHAKVPVYGEIIRITMLALPLQAIALPMTYALEASGRFTEVARLSIYSTVVSIASSVGLIYGWGLQGACWATVVRPALVAGAMLVPFVRAFPAVLPRMPLLGLAGSTLVMILLVRHVEGLHLRTAVELSLGLGWGGIGYVTLLCVFQVIPPFLFKPLLKR